jgi:aryl-alcohol dehydrogenase-like predicted oxidoreductase
VDYRTLGKTELTVSALGFGCGAVGGLMVAGEWPEQVAAVERAVEAGITYFDTAQSYGDGRSETNLGKVLQVVRPAVVVGTKVQLDAAGMEQIEQAIIAAAEVSLRRLQLEQLDLFQLHNFVSRVRQPERRWIGVDDLEAVTRAFQQLQTQGKIRHWGMNGLGETDALHQAVANSGAETVQVCYNLLNPSAGQAVPPVFAYQDFRGLIELAAAQQMGVIAIRVLAGGALSGQPLRHAVAAQSVAPIATGASYADDVAAAQRFRWLVEEGWAGNLVEGAIRFAMSHPAISTVMVGLSSLAQLEQAIAAAEQGPLPAKALERLLR